MSAAEKGGFPSVEELSPPAREALGDLLLVLADNKRLLGMRYADWILGAPALEAGISCSAMAQDEWGHGRILYAMLRDFGLDPDRLEHEREAAEYRSSELLDRPVESWPGLLALNLLLDTALSVRFESMTESRFEPILYKVSKLLDEERFHFEHARGWTLRLAATEKGRAALREAFLPAAAACLRWFGPEDEAAGLLLAAEGITDAPPAELRSRWRERLGNVLEAAGLEVVAEVETDFPGEWDPVRRRPAGGGEGPDADTLARVRGDRNRALLMD